MEGVIKYKQHFSRITAIPDELITDLKKVRRRLFELKLIGEDDTGTGYGNISIRETEGNNFLITASQTSQLPEISGEHICRVIKADPVNNEVFCEGPQPASSEAMTHAAIYDLSPDIKAVIHVHSAYLWQKYLDKLPTASVNVEYGTPGMAGEIRRLFSGFNSIPDSGVFVTAGHQDGLFSFGRSIYEAESQLFNLL